MEQTSNIFLNNSSEKIHNKIKNGEWNDIFNNLCFIKDNSIVLNYIYFKHIANEHTYLCILNHITNTIDTVLQTNNNFSVYVNMKNLTIIDVDKHRPFIQHISIVLKDKYPQKLTKCYVYNAPFIISQLFNIVSIFIDKDTQQKIEIVK